MASRSLLLRRGVRGLSTLPGPHDVISSSRIPTMHFQDSLPKLPLPPLEDTLSRMLYAATPLVTADELEEMRTLAPPQEELGEARCTREELLW